MYIGTYFRHNFFFSLPNVKNAFNSFDSKGKIDFLFCVQLTLSKDLFG